MLDLLRTTYHRLPLVRRMARRIFGTRLHDPTVKAKHVFMGTAYGGWAVMPSLLNPSAVVYSFGVGYDISFDLALIGSVGCAVHAFDPTPVSMAWLEQQSLPPQFHFSPIGVAATNGKLPFYADATWDS